MARRSAQFSALAWSRRAVLRGLLGAALVAPAAAAVRKEDATDAEGMTLTPWRRGQLDIHHISTGRGDATLVVAPDGTTILIDAGAIYAGGPFNLDLKPNGSRDTWSDASVPPAAQSWIMWW